MNFIGAPITAEEGSDEPTNIISDTAGPVSEEYSTAFHVLCPPHPRTTQIE